MNTDQYAKEIFFLTALIDSLYCGHPFNDGHRLYRMLLKYIATSNNDNFIGFNLIVTLISCL